MYFSCDQSDFFGLLFFFPSLYLLPPSFILFFHLFMRPGKLVDMLQFTIICPVRALKFCAQGQSTSDYALLLWIQYKAKTPMNCLPPRDWDQQMPTCKTCKIQNWITDYFAFKKSPISFHQNIHFYQQDKRLHGKKKYIQKNKFGKGHVPFQ